MILCAGEALIDMLPRRSEGGEDAFAPHAGGAVFNTAIALGRLGAPVGLLTGLSTDLFGEVLEAALSAAGVDTSLAVRSGRPTTLAFVKLTDGHASYAFYDENTAGRMLTPADMPDVPNAVGALFFGGISLAVEPSADAYAALLDRAGGTRAVMMDPNIRPGFIRDEAAYRSRLGAMLAAADIVKVSDEDLAWISGTGDLDAGISAMLDAGPSLVCVTKGAAGVLGRTRALSVEVPSRKVEVVDTVGAGDTFNAGLLASLHEAGVLSKDGIGALGETTLRDALDLGAAAAAVTVSRAGANPPRRDELA